MKRQPIPPHIKRDVYARCNGKCRMCGEKINFKKSTMYHVVPRSRGGTDDAKNLRLACKKCNNFRSNLSERDLNRKIRGMFWKSIKASLKMTS